MKNLLLFVLLTSVCFSQEKAKEHTIDSALKECLATPSGKSTAGMITCTVTAENAWDVEMNKYYKLLLSILSPDVKTKLKEAQRQWIAYRDKELQFSSTAFGSKDGTIWSVIAANNHLEIIKKRTLELTEYYELLTQE